MKIDFSALPPAPTPLCFTSARRVEKRDGTVRVRLAETHEAVEVLRMYIQHLFPIANFTPDVEACGLVVYRMIAGKTMFVAVRNGEIIGVAGFMILRQWYMAREQLWEQGAVVAPEFRRGPAAYRLVHALMDEAKSRGLDFVISANVAGAGSVKMMAKRFRKTGELFVAEFA